MSATIANDLFAVMEKQMGAAAVRAAAAAYLANSQGSAAAPAEKAPRPPMSEEHKAKLKAGREAALAKKAAEKAAGGAPAEPVKAAPSPQSDSSGQKKRGPKPLAEMTAEERAIHDAKVAERAAKKAMEKAAVQPPTTVQQADPTIFAEFTHKGVKYLRNMRGDLLSSEYEWVGRFDGKNIDTKFAKPADLEDEEEAAE